MGQQQQAAMYGAAFYSNICRLLSTLNGGIKHQRPSVRLPLSKVRGVTTPHSLPDPPSHPSH